ncbi:MAG TPA: hypothetical protein VGL89_11650 [Candidatus Koribacter sp.]|jgi:hypothetical protein
MRIRRLFWMILCFLLSTNALWAKGSDDWQVVTRLKWDSPLRVELWSGQEYAGRFDMADEHVFRLKLPSHDSAGRTGTVLTFAREQVRIVLRISNHYPDLETYQRAGMIAGGITGAAVLGMAVKHSAWPAGALLGGAMGLGGGALLGGMAGLAAHGAGRHEKVAYQSRTEPPVARPPDPHEQ